MVTFTSLEKKAIYNITTLMMMVDGRIAVPERDYWRKVAVLLHITEQEQKDCISLSKSESVSILRNMSATKKVIAIKIFTEMAVADGIVDPREHNLLDSLMDEINAVDAANSIGNMDALKSVIDEYNRR